MNGHERGGLGPEREQLLVQLAAGELRAEDPQVRSMLAADPELADRWARLQATGELLARTFHDGLAELTPVPALAPWPIAQMTLF